MQLSKCDSQANGSVVCFKCSAPLQLRFATADLDGPAFKAYYCPNCVRGIAPRPVDIRRDDHEPVSANQVERGNPKSVDLGIDKAYGDYYYGRDKEED